MSRLAIYQVDAFTDRIFSGNPAAVCPLDRWLPDATLQAIAAENNLSETAFFVADGDDYALRWFTPLLEDDLCGHATLAAGFVILTRLSPDRSAVRFHTRSGPLTVTRQADLFAVDLPALPPVRTTMPDRVREALGHQPMQILAADTDGADDTDADGADDADDADSADGTKGTKGTKGAEGTEGTEGAEGTDDTDDTDGADGADGGGGRRCSAGRSKYVVLYRDAAEVAALTPDMAALADIDRDGVIVTAPGTDCDFVSRYFAPHAGIPEDPVTGSAHCSLVPYWAARLGKTTLHARQISRRGGELFCELRGDRVTVAGRAVLYLEGHITI